MTPELWRSIEEHLRRLIPMSAEDRRAALKALGNEDSALSDEVARLLASADTLGNYLAEPLTSVATSLMAGDETELVGSMVGPYRLERTLGAGGMGRVYLARDTRLDRKVAVKLLSPDLEGDAGWEVRFQREARLASALDHPGICAVYDVGQQDGLPYIVMRFIDGRPLADEIDARPMDSRRLLEIAVCIAEALQAAHAGGVIHRDIKSRNVMITARGTPVVLDFGIAKRAAGASLEEATANLTMPGGALGTPASMSPEQAAGAVVDARSDIFSFGAVLYEMATGRLPFAGSDRRELMTALMSTPHQPAARLNPALPSDLSSLIDRMLAKAPGDRPQSMDLVVTELQRIARQQFEQPEGGARYGRLGIRALAMMALVLLLAVASWVVLRSSTPTVAEPTRTSTGSLAVLPLRNLGGEAADQYFADGLTEELIGLLSRIEGLRVPSRASSFAMLARPHTPAEIGAQLSVAHILDGSVRRLGGNTRISAQLVRIADDRILWSQSFDRANADLFAVQDEIAAAIARALQVELGMASPHGLLGVGTRDPAAYDAYLRGLQVFRLRGTSDLNEGRRWFEQAIERDPQFARAHGALATLLAEHVVLRYTSPTELSNETLRERAVSSARKALEHDPRSSDAFFALGLVAGQRKLWSEALAQLDRGFELDPAHADGLLWRAVHNVALGRIIAAETDIEAALWLDPASRVSLDWAARIASLRGQWERVMDLTDQVLALGLANSVIFHTRFSSYIDRLDADSLEAEIDAYGELLDPWVLSLYSPQVARIRELVQTNAVEESRHALLAEIFLQDGIEAGIERLHEDFDMLGPGGIGWVWYPQLDELRRAPGFAAATREFGFQSFWRAHGWPDLCRPATGALLDCD